MRPRLIGMVHLGPLPGSPSYRGEIDAVVAAAVLDARVLESAGFDGVIVENFGDAPFFADDVPKVTVAAMARAAADVRRAVGIPVGVNVLRNDGLAAVAVAASSGASFIRINVLSGIMTTDQGTITGQAAAIARARRELTPDLWIMADVFVKHAVPPAGLSIEQAASDLARRGGAGAIIVSGDATGRPPGIALVRKVKAAAGDVPVYVGSGVTAGTAGRFLSAADGVIVGTSLKQRGVTTNPVAANRARAFVAAATP
jgi:membrane complex biogenesis BtpA family protein